MLKQVKPYLIIACHDEMQVQLLNTIYGESSSKEIV
ncbi:hypothetical protein BASU183_16860 [Bacillus subtilis]|nr:hypothetical protein NRS6085_03254 [Bacillus subtilis]CAI6223787.1 hypothetical protein NRS6085_01580 [Bacillus subtilis]